MRARLVILMSIITSILKKIKSSDRRALLISSLLIAADKTGQPVTDAKSASVAVDAMLKQWLEQEVASGKKEYQQALDTIVEKFCEQVTALVSAQR